jgi:membrane-bound lytic murein transglycosylase D
MAGYHAKLSPPVFVGALIIAMVFITILGFEREPGNSNQEKEEVNRNNYSVSFRLPDSVFFAGEKMPLDNFDTRESLERELITTAYRHSSTILIIKRSKRYFPVIEKILQQFNIPDDFKYLAVAESDLSNAISPAGATGFWQIMTATGKEEGMEINGEVDERYHIEKSTGFACEYFLKSYNKYGSWTLAAASYNSGRNAIDDQIEIQKENDYYDLLLNDETARYIFRVVAYKLIINNPEEYGFDIKSDEYYPVLKYTEVKVDSSISDFSRFAKNFGTNYKMLKFLNPWLRKPYLTNKAGKEYLIKIPEQGSRNSIYVDNLN